jgi:hypothetical protein
MIKKAFTTIELIFVIVLIGIMSGVASTYFKDDKLAMAAYQTLDHIRYTQHLAIGDHKFDPKDRAYANTSFSGNNGKYYRSWWQIRFVMQMNGAPQIVGYSVYSDRDRKGNIDRTTHQEAAVNPFDGLYLNTFVATNSSPDVNLLSRYSIANIAFSQNCQAVGFTTVQGDVGAIIFDEKGRPYFGIANNVQNNPYQYRLTANCDITLTHQDGRQAVIRIYPETGYAEITKLD